MRAASHPSLKEGKVNSLAGSTQLARGAGKGSSKDVGKEENTVSVEDVAGIPKPCDTLEEQPEGGRRLCIRGLPLVFLPQHVEALWELVAAADAATASDKRACTSVEVIPTERSSTQAPGTAAFAPTTQPGSPTQPLRRQDSPRSRQLLTNAASESPAALAARPPSPSDPHASLQRKHASAAAGGQRRNPAGQGKEGHNANKQNKSVNGSGTGSTPRAGMQGTSVGLSNATTVATPGSSVSGTGGSAPNGGRHSSRPGVFGGAPANLDPSSHTDISADGARERRSNPKGDTSAMLRELICQHLSGAGKMLAEQSACAAVVELHVFSLIFAGTIGLCSRKAALYMSIIAAAVEELEQEEKLRKLCIPRQVESLRKRIREQTFDPFAKYSRESYPAGQAFQEATCAAKSDSAYPTFSRMEAQKLFRFAVDTFVAHSRLYSYCMRYPRKQVASVNVIYTYIPIVPPLCAVTASSLFTPAHHSEGSSAAPATGEEVPALQQERRRSAELTGKAL